MSFFFSKSIRYSFGRRELARIAASTNGPNEAVRKYETYQQAYAYQMGHQPTRLLRVPIVLQAYNDFVAGNYIPPSHYYKIANMPLAPRSTARIPPADPQNVLPWPETFIARTGPSTTVLVKSLPHTTETHTPASSSNAPVSEVPYSRDPLEPVSLEETDYEFSFGNLHLGSRSNLQPSNETQLPSYESLSRRSSSDREERSSSRAPANDRSRSGSLTGDASHHQSRSFNTPAFIHARSSSDIHTPTQSHTLARDQRPLFSLSPLHKRYLRCHYKLNRRQIRRLNRNIKAVVHCSWDTMNKIKDSLVFLGLTRKRAEFFILFVFGFDFGDSDDDSDSDSSSE